MKGAVAFRGVVAAVTVVIGVVILVRTFAFVSTGGFAILPGVVLGLAMVALGAHRISLILRMQKNATR